MIPLEDAQAVVLAGCAPLPARPLPLADLLGCVLAEVIVAPGDVPPFDNTAMDGFAVRAADTTAATPERPVTLRIASTVTAGMSPQAPVAPGTAVRIMTGAPMPQGADAVVMVEATQAPPGEDLATAATVLIGTTVAPGTHVRRRGEDLRAGQTVFEPGTVLGPGHLGVLASLGCTEATVIGRPRVGVCSTGDELVEGSAALAPGQIRDSNRPTLLALVRQAGWEPVDLGIVADEEDAIEETFRNAANHCDAVLSSGGVSMGDVDLVKVVLDRIGEMIWMQVAIKPAKPLAFGVLEADDGRRVPIFGLPGNPVSSMVSFELFARPGIRRLAGHAEEDLVRPTVPALAAQDLLRRADGKTHFVRVRSERAADGRFLVRPQADQGSHQLAAMADADGLAVVGDGPGVRVGEEVEFLPFGP